MISNVKDIPGMGKIAEETRKLILAIVRHKEQKEGQRLRNQEQALKNREREVQILASLLALSETYPYSLDELFSLTESLTSDRSLSREQRLLAQKVLTLPKESNDGIAVPIMSHDVPLS